MADAFGPITEQKERACGASSRKLGCVVISAKNMWRDVTARILGVVFSCSKSNLFCLAHLVAVCSH